MAVAGFGFNPNPTPRGLRGLTVCDKYPKEEHYVSLASLFLGLILITIY